MLLYLLALAVGCAALYGGGDLLVRGAIGTGRALSLSPAVIGLVFVSLGTSAPELFVSAGAAWQGYGDVAAGNALGSNIVNLCLVLGLGAVLGGLPIERGIRDRQLPLMIAVTLLAVLLLGNGHLGRIEGALLLAVTAAGLWWIVSGDRGSAASMLAASGAEEPGGGGVGADVSRGEGTASAEEEPPLSKNLLLLAGGVVILLIGAEALIYGGVGLAGVLGVPDAVIALTVTSIGTGLPEITATVLAAVKKEHALAVANVVGSNLLNLGLVLGSSSLLTPIESGGITAATFVALVVLSFGLWALAWRPGHVSRAVGGILLGLYAVYVFALVA